MIAFDKYNCNFMDDDDDGCIAGFGIMLSNTDATCWSWHCLGDARCGCWQRSRRHHGDSDPAFFALMPDACDAWRFSATTREATSI